MDKYKNVQNPHLYQQLLEEERKRQAKIAQTKTSSTNFYNAMHNISGGQTKATPSIPSKESVLNAMKRAQSTNTYINLYSQAMQNGYIKSSAKAPEPTTKKTDEKTETPGGKQTFKIPGVKGVRWVYVPRGDGTGYSIQKPIYEEDYDPLAEELTEEEIQERVLQAFNARNNATSSNQFNYYNSLLFEGRYQLPEPKGVKTKSRMGRQIEGKMGRACLATQQKSKLRNFLKRQKMQGFGQNRAWSWTNTVHIKMACLI